MASNYRSTFYCIVKKMEKRKMKNSVKKKKEKKDKIA